MAVFHNLRLLFAIPALLAAGSNASAAGELSSGICWVSDVRVLNDGIRVYFPRTGGPMFVARRGSTFIPAAAPAEPDTPDAALSAVLGEELFASNGPEDNCTLNVVRKDGKIGLEAHATMSLPGLPHQSETQFIPAR